VMRKPGPIPPKPSPGRRPAPSRGLTAGLCLAGAAGLFSGMLLGSHALFLGGLGLGLTGYLRVRRRLKEALKEEDRIPTPNDDSASGESETGER